MKPSTTLARPIELVRRLGRTWEAVQPVIARSLAAQGLNDRVQPGMGLVLFALFERDGQPIRDLARHGHVSHVAVLRLARRMESCGLVACRDCPDDGRSTRVWLTESCRALEGPLRAASDSNLETLTRILGAQDAIRLNDLLGRLLDGLDTEIGKGTCTSSRQEPAGGGAGRATKTTSTRVRR